MQYCGELRPGLAPSALPGEPVPRNLQQQGQVPSTSEPCTLIRTPNPTAPSTLEQLKPESSTQSAIQRTHVVRMPVAMSSRLIMWLALSKMYKPLWLRSKQRPCRNTLQQALAPATVCVLLLMARNLLLAHSEVHVCRGRHGHGQQNCAH